MTEQTIFPDQTLDRRMRWEKYLYEYTPWENHQGIWFKRDDYFAPLGYGGPNGSKLRQLIWMMNKQREGKTHVLSGASIRSPQLSMSTIVGAHYGLPTRLVVGGTKPSTVLKSPNPYIAAGFGAHFEFIKVGYNPEIQRNVHRLARPDSLVVEYGITLPHQTSRPEDVVDFHGVGAKQIENMPLEVRRLIMPAGSCNSLCSVLLGLSMFPGNLAQLFTLGIGPDKMDWVKERLQIMGVDLKRMPFEWRHYSLHEAKYAAYGDYFKGEEHDGIKFHGTYEAKMWRWLRENEPISPNDKTAFWIVGSDPLPQFIKKHFTHEPQEQLI